MDSMAGIGPGKTGEAGKAGEGDAGSGAAGPWWVVCLCAQWCGVCNQYQGAFAQLAAQFPHMRFVWLDVEDREDVAGDLDIETFPSMLVAQGGRARFLGPVLPQAGVLARMLQSLAQDPAASAAEPEVAQALLQRLQAARDLKVLAH